MGIFDKFKNKEQKGTIKSPQAFYTDCTAEFHKTALNNGLACKGAILIPELLPLGQKAVMAFLRDPFFQMEYGSNPSMLYYVIMSLCIQTGMVYADKWHENYDELKNGFAVRIIEEGPADSCKQLLKQMSLDDIDKENEYYQKIFSDWLKMHEPYWKLQDPREYTFMAMLAAYQLGISMVLEKYGY